MNKEEIQDKSFINGEPNMKEVWKDIKGFEGFYQVSNMGRVKSLERTITRKDGRTDFETNSKPLRLLASRPL